MASPPPPPVAVDVLIVGCGSAGLCAAVWLTRFPDVHFRILERRPSPLDAGQADGVQTRTVEALASFGLGPALLAEACPILDLAFWSDERGDGAERDGAELEGWIRRQRLAPDTPAGLSHMPHVTLGQARLNGLMREELERMGRGDVIEHGCEVVDVRVDEAAAAADADAYAVEVDAVQDGRKQTYRARYVLGCDGAHSAVRHALAIPMVGDTTDAVWGVMDVYPLTSFPDLRRKTTVRTARGNLLLIPREGGRLVRFYTELPAGTTVGAVTLASLQARAAAIMAPRFTLRFGGTDWWSAYTVGQRVAGRFAVAGRVFLAGDACHTHSPKAGQGMNVSLQDGYNIGWKLGLVLAGRAGRPLLDTYVAEREGTARELIAFDREWTRWMGSRAAGGVTDAMFVDAALRSARYTAGQAIRYGASAVVAETDARTQALARGLVVGERFPTAQVVRFADGRAMQLVEALPATGRWYVVVFAGDAGGDAAAAAGELAQVAGALQAVVRSFTPAGADPDSVIDPVLVLSGPRMAMEPEEIPDFFRPATGAFHMTDVMKVFFDDETHNASHGHAYEFYGVAQDRGVIAVVRPDHYLAQLAPIDDTEAVRRFFAGFLLPATGQ